jgi:hypothetical protein
MAGAALTAGPALAQFLFPPDGLEVVVKWEQLGKLPAEQPGSLRAEVPGSWGPPICSGWRSPGQRLPSSCRGLSQARLKLRHKAAGLGLCQLPDDDRRGPSPEDPEGSR